MHPVELAPEPGTFEEDVRRRGHEWLRARNLVGVRDTPEGVEVKPYWTKCLAQLWESYGGICAYSSLYIPRTTGARTVEHFAPKSRRLDLAYEWTNYRLVSQRLNGYKSAFEDVLDPVGLQEQTFKLNFGNGSIKPNPRKPKGLRDKASETIERLRLASPEINLDRIELWNNYLSGDISETHLRRHCPFIWFEANTEGMLKAPGAGPIPATRPRARPTDET